jgi:hypothetical protein
VRALRGASEAGGGSPSAPSSKQVKVVVVLLIDGAVIAIGGIGWRRQTRLTAADVPKALVRSDMPVGTPRWHLVIANTGVSSARAFSASDRWDPFTPGHRSRSVFRGA